MESYNKISSTEIEITTDYQVRKRYTKEQLDKDIEIVQKKLIELQSIKAEFNKE